MGLPWNAVKEVKPVFKTIIIKEAPMIQRRAKPIELKEYFRSTNEIEERFKSLPKIKNLRTSAENDFLKQGLPRDEDIRYYPGLKIRQ